ncbi:MAG: hypothetical protein INR71_16045, partial [Terriglobus roseus]|nr:hypothetical protein [Terriglobus roseus]
MVAQKPKHLDLAGTGFSDAHSRRSPMTSPGELAPPRTGDIPPALSPLDAFAFQSRILARKFEEEQDNGRRLSRLPPLTIQNQFAKRPGYFRANSSEASSAADESPVAASDQDTPNTGTISEVEDKFRPRSHYPMFEGGDDLSTASAQKTHVPSLYGIGEEQEFWTPQQVPSQSDSYFDIPRAQSPDAFEPRVIRPTPTSPNSRLHHTDSFSADSLSIASPTVNLKPPRSPMSLSALKNSPSIRSVNDSSDDVDALSMNESIDSMPPRKPSTNSSYSRSHSPQVPFQAPMPRSPSAASEASWTSAPRP